MSHSDLFLYPLFLQPLTVIRWSLGDGTYFQTVIKSIERENRLAWARRLRFEVETMIEPTGYPEHGSLYRAPSPDGWINQTEMERICRHAVDVRLPKWSWI